MVPGDVLAPYGELKTPPIAFALKPATSLSAFAPLRASKLLTAFKTWFTAFSYE
jgi:hypothetical protein